MRFIINESLKEYILERLTEVDIFAYYLDLSEVDIYQCLYQPSHKISNPHRTDSHPSLSFMNQNGRIRAKDWANPFYTGDCFQLVGNIYGLDSNHNKDFIKICKRIIKDILDGDHHISISTEQDRHQLNKLLKRKIKDYIKIIEFETKDVTTIDKEFWNRIEVNPYVLPKHYTYIANRVWINNRLFFETHPRNPAYIYFLGLQGGINLYEIYQPLTTDKGKKFRTNNKFDLKGLFKIKDKADILIINKSGKDSICVNEILSKEIKDLSIVNINYHSESVRLKPQMVNILKAQYKFIINMTDNDEAGIKCAEFHQEEYGFYPYFTRLKDFTDTIQSQYRDEEVNKLIDFIYNIIK